MKDVMRFLNACVLLQFVYWSTKQAAFMVGVSEPPHLSNIWMLLALLYCTTHWAEKTFPSLREGA